MSRIKESLVVLLDISPTMHGYLEDLKTAITTLIRRKIFYSKNDEAGIILFGANEADNDLHKTIGGYESVVVSHPVEAVDNSHLEVLDKLPKGSAPGDYLDAVVVAMDLLIKKLGPGSKGNKRLLLMTNALSLIKEPYEGTKMDQVDIIANQMKGYGMKLDVAIYQPMKFKAITSDVFEENVSLIKRFSKNAQAQVTIVEDSTTLLGVIKPRTVNPVTIFRGDMEVTPLLRIKVWVYKKTCQERLPSLKRYSDKAPSNDWYATREAKMDIVYKSKDDPDKIIPSGQKIKGFFYGPHVVPISSIQEEALKFKPEKGVKILGFTERANVRRYYYMKDVNIFIPEPGNSKAILAVSAIARAMYETGKVAIARCVWRQGQTNVVLGVLTPHFSDDTNMVDSFLFNVIPFAEDVREFPFPSFDNLPPSQQPNISQQEAADNLVQIYDLAPPGRQEILNPDFTVNPLLERFFRFLDMKSRKLESTVPPVDRTLKRIVEPDPVITTETELAMKRFCNEFQLKINTKGKSKKEFWKDKPSFSGDAGRDEEDDLSTAQSEITYESLAAKKVDKVGSLTPVQDFHAMLARRDSDEWVPKAIKEMKKIIIDLLEMSYKGNTYLKALDCLVALRKGCVQEEEPIEFNSFMHEVVAKLRAKRLGDFWDLLVSHHVTLISKNEAPDSNVSEEEAKEFLERGLQLQEEKAEQVDEMELLMGEIM